MNNQPATPAPPAQRTISTEAVAMRERLMARRAEQDALILQDDLLQANEMIRQLTAELAAAKTEIETLKGTKADGK